MLPVRMLLGILPCPVSAPSISLGTRLHTRIVRSSDEDISRGPATLRLSRKWVDMDEVSPVGTSDGLDGGSKSMDQTVELWPLRRDIQVQSSMSSLYRRMV